MTNWVILAVVVSPLLLLVAWAAFAARGAMQVVGFSIGSCALSAMIFSPADMGQWLNQIAPFYGIWVLLVFLFCLATRPLVESSKSAGSWARGTMVGTPPVVSLLSIFVW